MADYIMTDNGDGTYTLTPTSGSDYGEGPGDPLAVFLWLLSCIGILLDITAVFGMVYVFATEFIMKMGFLEGLVNGIPLIIAFIVLMLVNIFIIANIISVCKSTTSDDTASASISTRILASIGYGINKFCDFFVYFIYAGALAITILSIPAPETDWYYLLLFAFTTLSGYFYLLRIVDYVAFVKRNTLETKWWLDIILSIVIAPFGLLAALIISFVVQLPFYFMNLPYYAAGNYFDLSTTDAAMAILLVCMVGYFDIRKRMLKRKHSI